MHWSGMLFKINLSFNGETVLDGDFNRMRIWSRRNR